jgi:general L-amino acid transport system permease protein
VRLVVIPQAMPVIIPPITSQYLNLIKNSSFGAAIAYPEIVAVFMGSALVSTGQSIEIIAITLAIYLTLSLAVSAFMNWYNARHRMVQRDDRPAATGDLFATPIDAAITLICLYIVWRHLGAAGARGCCSTRPGTAPAATTARAPAPAGCSCACASASSCTASIRCAERWRVDLVGGLWVLVTLALSWRGLPHRAWATSPPSCCCRRRHRAAARRLGHRPRLVEIARMGRADADPVPHRLCRPDRHPARRAAGARPPLAPAAGPLRLGRVHRVLARRADHHRDLPRLAAAAADHADRLRHRPPGARRDRLAFVIAAYMAEAVRGGLQALPDGQTEAAQALGLGYWRIQRMIVLPQALRIALPAMTNEFISLFKSTTLVLIVSIFDLLGIAQAALADPAWVGMNMEAYVFAGAIYWFGCFGLSQWSRGRERRLQLAHGR